MKDVAACDKLRGGGKQPMIRRSPNGETYTDEVGMPRTEYIGALEGTWGSETSQYPEEKRKIITLTSCLLRGRRTRSLLFVRWFTSVSRHDSAARQDVSSIPLVAASESGRA